MRQIDGSLFDKSPQAFGVIRVDLSGKRSSNEFKLVYLNEAFIKLGGIENKQPINKSFYHIFSECSEEWVETFYEAAYNGRIIEIRGVLGADGCYFSIICFPIKRGYCGCILIDHSDIFNLFYGSVFFAHIYMDLEKDVYSCLYLEEAIRENVPDKGRVSELAGILKKRIVYPDDYEDFCSVLEKEYICRQLRPKEHSNIKGSCYIDFRSMQAGEIKNCRMILLNEEQEADRDVRYVHMFLQNIHGKGRIHEKTQRKEIDHSEYVLKDRKETIKIQDAGGKRSELDMLMAADFTGNRILLVEDNEVNREMLAGILMATGAEVEKAENGRAAVEYVKSLPAGYYDIIFMDISMPFMNGYDAAKAIRALEHEDKGQVPMIAMTANVFKEDVIAVKNAGMNGYIAKPIDFKEMGKILGKWLGKEAVVK